jgi:hypothetical protein
MSILKKDRGSVDGSLVFHVLNVGFINGEMRWKWSDNIMMYTAELNIHP